MSETWENRLILGNLSHFDEEKRTIVLRTGSHNHITDFVVRKRLRFLGCKSTLDQSGYLINNYHTGQKIIAIAGVPDEDSRLLDIKKYNDRNSQSSAIIAFKIMRWQRLGKRILLGNEKVSCL